MITEKSGTVTASLGRTKGYEGRQPMIVGIALTMRSLTAIDGVASSCVGRAASFAYAHHAVSILDKVSDDGC